MAYLFEHYLLKNPQEMKDMNPQMALAGKNIDMFFLFFFFLLFFFFFFFFFLEGGFLSKF